MPVIDCSAPEGNAFSILGAARNWAKQLGWPKERISKICSEAMSGDYKNLLTVIEREFSDIDLEFENDPRQPSDDED